MAGEVERLALVPDMVAGGHYVGAAFQGLQEDLFRDAEAAGGVLAIDHDEIETVVGDKAGQLIPRRRPSAASHKIAQKKQPHALPSIRARPVQAAFGENRRHRNVVCFAW